MKIQFSKQFYKIYKAQDVKIRNAFDRKIKIFIKDPHNSELKNHELHSEYEGLRSINVTSDYRAIYEELEQGKEKIAYFSIIGTHEELYDKKMFIITLKK